MATLWPPLPSSTTVTQQIQKEPPPTAPHSCMASGPPANPIVPSFHSAQQLAVLGPPGQQASLANSMTHCFQSVQQAPPTNPTNHSLHPMQQLAACQNGDSTDTYVAPLNHLTNVQPNATDEKAKSITSSAAAHISNGPHSHPSSMPYQGAWVHAPPTSPKNQSKATTQSTDPKPTSVDRHIASLAADSHETAYVSTGNANGFQPTVGKSEGNVQPGVTLTENTLRDVGQNLDQSEVLPINSIETVFPSNCPSLDDSNITPQPTTADPNLISQDILPSSSIQIMLPESAQDLAMEVAQDLSPRPPSHNDSIAF
ncbi:hypothetical protein F0562_007647 [Nyssa sinensis]|uniref:Uncharacterized protein n=1 Tax=Nyssa sinensis TaxID=561372 RepID=A0A5J5A7E7_9ASTE|nr:hypothetical protein F0562_007647 [Nyssa sinensis]